MQNKDKGKIKILYEKWQEHGFIVLSFICSLLSEGDGFSEVILSKIMVWIFKTLYKKLEKALRALASSSGGAACPAGRGLGWGVNPGGRGYDSKAI